MLEDGLDIRKERRLKVELGSELQEIAKAAFLYVPVQEWHHDEHFPIAESAQSLLGFELPPKQLTTSITTIDQFGMHTLEAGSRRFLLTPAEITDLEGDRSRPSARTTSAAVIYSDCQHRQPALLPRG